MLTEEQLQAVFNAFAFACEGYMDAIEVVSVIKDIQLSLVPSEEDVDQTISTITH